MLIPIKQILLEELDFNMDYNKEFYNQPAENPQYEKAYLNNTNRVANKIGSSLFGQEDKNFTPLQKAAFNADGSKYLYDEINPNPDRRTQNHLATMAASANAYRDAEDYINKSENKNEIINALRNGVNTDKNPASGEHFNLQHPTRGHDTGSLLYHYLKNQSVEARDNYLRGLNQRSN